MQYLWIDIEATGKDVNRCSICEIACFITGDDFVERNVFHEVISQPDAFWERGALEMHLKSGLLQEMQSDKARPEQEVITSFANYLDKHKVENEKFYFTGSTVHFDKYILNSNWGNSLPDYFSHQVADVSSIKVFLRGLLGSEKAFEFDNTVGGMRMPEHRALDDIRYSAELFRFYKSKGYIGSLTGE